MTQDRTHIAARCPTCAALVETEVASWPTPGPLPLPRETLVLHANCDIVALYAELQRASRSLVPLIRDFPFIGDQ